MEGQLLLATLAQRVRFELVPKQQRIDLDPKVTLRPKGDVTMGVWRRSDAGRAP